MGAMGRAMGARGNYIAKMTLFSQELKTQEPVTCVCTRALLRYDTSPNFQNKPKFKLNPK